MQASEGTRPLTHAERGRLGGRRKWDREAATRGAPTGQRIVRLDALPPEVANVIRQLVAAAEAAQSTTTEAA